MKLILASASPRRADLLRSAGYSFEQTAVEVDERVRPGESAVEYVQRLAADKSERAWTATVPRADLVVGADTAVVLDDQILGKPRSDEDAEGMLRQLSGRAHVVVTGVSVRSPRGHLCMVEATSVWFGVLGADEIAWYIASGEGRDKAGAYAIQGLASRFIHRIEGSYSNVVGLPVATVHTLLKRCREAGAGFPAGH
jgi:septum formation protein